MRKLVYFSALSIPLLLNSGFKAIPIATLSFTLPDSTQIIKVRKLPAFKVFLGSSSGDSISKGELDTVSRIYVKPADSMMKEGVNYTIQEYSLAVVMKGGRAYFFNCSGNKISNELLSRLHKVESGDLIAIKDLTINTYYGWKQIYGGTYHVK